MSDFTGIKAVEPSTSELKRNHVPVKCRHLLVHMTTKEGHYLAAGVQEGLGGNVVAFRQWKELVLRLGKKRHLVRENPAPTELNIAHAQKGRLMEQGVRASVSEYQLSEQETDGEVERETARADFSFRCRAGEGV